MCIPTFVDFFVFNLSFFFFFVSFVFFFLLFFSRCSQGPYCIFFLFFFVRSLPDSFIPRFIPIFFSSGFSSSWSTAPLWNVTPSPPHIISLSLLTMSSYLPAGDQLVVRGGNAHFFTYTWIRSRETGEDRRTKRTNNKLWGYQEQREVCNTTCICIPDSRYMDYR